MGRPDFESRSSLVFLATFLTLFTADLASLCGCAFPGAQTQKIKTKGFGTLIKLKGFETSIKLKANFTWTVDACLDKNFREGSDQTPFLDLLFPL